MTQPEFQNEMSDACRRFVHERVRHCHKRYKFVAFVRNIFFK